MFLSQELGLEIVRRDLDPDFTRSFAVGLAWGYRGLFRQLRESEGLTDEYRNETFNRQRSDVATRVLIDAAKRHGIPYEFVKLRCNGQSKPVVKSGRLVLILEAVSYFDEHPQVADYKVSLSDTHSYMRQYELDLGDKPNRIRDWGGTALGVLLHGASGSRFSQDSKDLGILTLGLPDAAYRQWTSRIDLQRTAVHGSGYKENSASTQPQPAENVQEDNVFVRAKRKNSKGVA